ELKFAGTTAALGDGKLSGTLKSAFGAPANWSATRKPAAEPAARNPVALSIDSGPDQKPADAGAAEQPVELEADRLRHPLATQGNVLIKGGTVIQSHGDPLPETNVLVRQGRIAAIGRDLVPDEGMTVIDAAGRFVMPGIIDTHSHIMFGDGTGGV